MRWRLIVAAAVALVCSSSAIRADVPPPPFLMRSFVVNMTNVSVPRGNAGVMEIRITGWSPAATRQRLIETFLAKGQDELLSALQKEKPKGRLRLPNWQVHLTAFDKEVRSALLAEKADAQQTLNSVNEQWEILWKDTPTRTRRQWVRASHGLESTD